MDQILYQIFTKNKLFGITGYYKKKVALYLSVHHMRILNQLLENFRHQTVNRRSLYASRTSEEQSEVICIESEPDNFSLVFNCISH